MFKWFAKKILKKELAALRKRALPKLPPLYVDVDDTDQLAYWREMAKWADDLNARRFAFEEINSVLNRLITVGNDNSEQFWVLQGYLASLNRFIRLPDMVEEKLKEVLNKIENPNGKEEELASISEINT